MLLAVFSKMIFDPFVPVRIATLQAIAATHQFYTIKETSDKVLPMICRLSTDADPNVRKLAFKIIKGFLDKLQQVSDDPNLREEMEFNVKITTTHPSEDLMLSAKGWASWAAEALSAKLYKSEPNSAKISDILLKDSLPDKPDKISNTLVSKSMTTGKKSSIHKPLDINKNEEVGHKYIAEKDRCTQEKSETTKTNDELISKKESSRNQSIKSNSKLKKETNNNEGKNCDKNSSDSDWESLLSI